jgi:hypothetical protein
VLRAGVKVLQASVESQGTDSWGSWMMSQSQYIKWGLLERKERLQLEECIRAWKLVTCWSGEGWGFYGCTSSELGGFFSWAVDSQTFSGELVWLAPLLGEEKQSWEHFAHQPCGRSSRPCIFFLGCRNVDLQLPLRVQECKPITLQDAGMIWLSRGDGIPIHLP